MSEMKYLSDGRKVAIIGRLNQSELIVQEVFVQADGGEIPSGEKFVVKSVHDAPVKSWKEKQCAEMEARYEQVKAKLKKVGDELKNAREAAKHRAQALKSFASNACEEALATLEAFVAGEITHVVVNNRHGRPEIKPFESMDLDVDNWHGNKYIDGTKLFCLCGKSNGDLAWNINMYRDHSGLWTEVTLCRSYDEAVRVAQGIYDARAHDWKNGKRKQPPSADQKIPELVPDVDVIKYWTEQSAKKREERIAKLREELKALLEESE
jgi:hypothetical protein